jgi:hypothetical protein
MLPLFFAGRKPSKVQRSSVTIEPTDDQDVPQRPTTGIWRSKTVGLLYAVRKNIIRSIPRICLSKADLQN